MAGGGGPPSQGWGSTFLRIHAPTHRGRRICSWFRPSALTCSWSLSGWLQRKSPHPTAEWIAQQVTEAFPWNEAPRYLIRDPDRTYGAATSPTTSHGAIRDKSIAPGSPLQKLLCERLIGSIRRECFDHIIALGEQQLRRVLKVLCWLLQHRENASLIGQGCATHASGSSGKNGSHIVSHALVGGLHYIDKC